MHIFPSIPNDSFEGYIFDCDGTLANSMLMHYECWCHVLSKHGAVFDFTWEIFRAHGGMGIRHSVELFNQKYNHSLNVDLVIEDIKIFCEANAHRTSPITAVIEAARHFGKTHPISVASGGMRTIVHKTLDIIGAFDLFDHVVTQDDVTNCKPHPEIFLYAAEKMGVNPQKCLVFEDSQLGIEAAKAAGMQFVVVIEDRLNPNPIKNEK